MKNNPLLILSLCFISFIHIYPQKTTHRKDNRPNILFIIADDLTTTAVSAYGDTPCQTPNIDQLARRGTRYTHAYCQYPVCGPSRASFLSGYYPHATKTFGYTSGRKNIGNRKMLPEIFKDNGYYTARVSKIFHMGVPIDIETGSNGKDDARCWVERFNSQAPEWKAKGEGELVQNNPTGTLPIRGGNVMTIVKADGDDWVHADGKTAEKAMALIKAHKNEPFFIAVGFVRPHVPFVAPKKYFNSYPYPSIIRPQGVKNDWDDIPKKGINYVNSVNAQMSATQEQKAIAAYYAAVSYMDAQVGKVLKTLKEEGLSDNTIVIFTSDHGFLLGEHQFWMKVSLMEESVKVPLIIKVPGKEPAICDSFVELIDLYPTLTQLASIEKPPHLQGRDLSPTLDNPKYRVRDMAFSVSQRGTALLLRSKKWAYIQYGLDAAMGIELYDMQKDPQQFHNLALDKAYAPMVNRFKRLIKSKLKAIGANDL